MDNMLTSPADVKLKAQQQKQQQGLMMLSTGGGGGGQACAPVPLGLGGPLLPTIGLLPDAHERVLQQALSLNNTSSNTNSNNATPTAALRTALFVASNVVASDSNGFLFLRAAAAAAAAKKSSRNSSIDGPSLLVRAAERLADYWTKRQSCFGARAFSPMNLLNGTGALSWTDVAALDASCLSQLLNDVHGNAVFVVETSKIARSLTPSGAKCLFYQLHQAAAVNASSSVVASRTSYCAAANQTGRVVLLVHDNSSSRTTDTTTTDESSSKSQQQEQPVEATHLDLLFSVLSELIHTVLPLQLVRVHIVSTNANAASTSGTTTAAERASDEACQEKAEEAAKEVDQQQQTLTTTAFQRKLRAAAQKHLIKDSSDDDDDDDEQHVIPVTLEASPQALAKKLEKDWGLLRSGLPLSLGGTYVLVGSACASSSLLNSMGQQQQQQPITQASATTSQLMAAGLNIPQQLHQQLQQQPLLASTATSRPLFLTTQALPLDHPQPTTQPVSSAVAQFAALSPTKQAMALASIQTHLQQQQQQQQQQHSPSNSSSADSSSPSSSYDTVKVGNNSISNRKGTKNGKQSSKKRDASAASLEGPLLDPEAEKERIRKRNAMYSRRKYERKKIEISVTKAEAARLNLQHATLLQEHERLKNLLRAAHDLLRKSHQSEHTAILVAASVESPPPSKLVVYNDSEEDDDDEASPLKE